MMAGCDLMELPSAMVDKDGWQVKKCGHVDHAGVLRRYKIKDFTGVQFSAGWSDSRLLISVCELSLAGLLLHTSLIVEE